MEHNNKSMKKSLPAAGADFIGHFWDKSWAYIKTVVDVVREPVLILDKDLKIMAANESFYRTFQAEPKDTENKIVYEIGNGQWNIPALRKLLEDILPRNSFFKGFEVVHEFPSIGRKVMILNARQIHVEDDTDFPPIILLAIEDVTEMMVVAESFATHTKQVETGLTERTGAVERRIGKLEKAIKTLSKK